VASVRSSCVPILSDPSEQQQQAELAVQALEQAVAAGFRDIERIKKDATLAAVRDRQDFQELVAGLEATVKVEALTASTPGTPEEKLKAHELALALRQKLAEADPKNRRIQADFAASQQAIGLVQMDLGRFDEAARSLAQARAVLEALVRDEPKNWHYRADLAIMTLNYESKYLLKTKGKVPRFFEKIQSKEVCG